MPYSDPDKQRASIREAKKRRYQTDPEYAARIKAEQNRYREKNPDKVKAAKRAYYEKNAAKISAHKKAQRPERYLWELQSKYGLSKEGYEALLERANGKCEICGATEKLAVDHCHDALVVRGMLCKHCNTGIGYFRDDPERLLAAAAYMVRFQRR